VRLRFSLRRFGRVPSSSEQLYCNLACIKRSFPCFEEFVTIERKGVTNAALLYPLQCVSITNFPVPFSGASAEGVPVHNIVLLSCRGT
jgi:hypothetical protein